MTSMPLSAAEHNHANHSHKEAHADPMLEGYNVVATALYKDDLATAKKAAAGMVKHDEKSALAVQAKELSNAKTIEEARKSLSAGGIPIGSVLVIDGKIVGRGHNKRIQSGSPVLHAEMDCLENAGRLSASDYQRSVLYSTLSPCDMCSGAILLYKIPTVVIGENRTFQGPEEHLRARGVEIQLIDNAVCVALMESFIENNPLLWNEDIGE